MPQSRRNTVQSDTASSLSQDSSQGDDQRFAALLRPIKDLTENWEVPLSQYLEEYYEELHDLQISLDGRKAKVNFAEAAMVLQGTVSVYSKKVEFVWQMVLKMLDLLSSRKALEGTEDEDGDGTGKKRGKKTGANFNEFQLISLDLGRNNDLKNDDIAVSCSKGLRERKMSLKFIFVTPRQLIEKENAEMKTIRINMYAQNSKDQLGHKEDFRVNCQYSTLSAMIGEDLGKAGEMAQQSVTLCEDTGLFELSNSKSPEKANAEPSGDHVEVPARCSADEPAATEDLFDDFVAPEAPDVDDYHQDEEDVPGTEPSPEGEQQQKKPRRSLKDNLEEPKAPIADPWEPVNPSDSVPIKKVQNKGRTCRAPTPDVILKKPERSRRLLKPSPNAIKVQFVETIEQYFIKDIVRDGYKDLNKSSVEQEFLEEVRKARKERRSRKEQEDKVQSPAEEQPPPDPDQEDEDVDDMPPPDDFEAPADGPDEFDELNPHEDLLHAIAGRTAPDSEDQSDGDPNSYEELVIKRVSAYVLQAQEYVESTDLAKRVAKWHDNIRPKLESVEKRGNFDVHAYGTRIIDSFPTDNRKSTITMQDVVGGCEKEEVARYFLSSLMLANTYNIELSQDSAEDMSNMNMTLLSTVRHHEELADYQAPSQEDEQFIRPSSTNSQPSKSQKGRGKKRKIAAPSSSLQSIREEPSTSINSPLPDLDSDPFFGETLESLDQIPSAGEDVPKENLDSFQRPACVEVSGNKSVASKVAEAIVCPTPKFRAPPRRRKL